MIMKCTICNQEYSAACDYRQGRCPHHPAMFNDRAWRFVNLWRAIKQLWKK
jgi:hypothetical protein